MRINYPEKFYDNRPSMIFIHGLCCNQTAWQYSIAYLKDWFNCITIDLYESIGEPNHSNFEVANLTTLICEAIKSHQLSNLTICGHSFGGQLAINICNEAPELFEQAVLIAPAGIENYSHFEQLMINQGARNLPTKLFTKIEEYLHLSFYHYDKHYRDLAISLFSSFNKLDSESQKKFFSTQLSEVLAANVNFKNKFNKPVLVIFGNMDSLVPNIVLHPYLTSRMMAAHTARLFTHASYRLINDAGHFPMLEQPEDVNQLIKKFAYTGTVTQPSQL
ncbi:MAG: alpha/beta hydrolase [Bacteroidetes bacterium]|nr:alpha/beta hydrolase [Bacteroidota bacterium]